MLQNIIGQNPDFYVTPTSGVLELLFSARQNYSNSPEFKAQNSEQMKAGWLGFCREGIQGFYNSITDKPFIVDKSRGWGIHYDFLNTFIDEPKVIVMIRDLRSIYASMEKNFRKNPETDKGIVDWVKMTGTNTEKRVNLWSQGPPVGIAIERLKSMIDQGILDKCLVIKYEDLTTSPQKEMDKLYAYLNKPTFNHDFNNIEQITQEDDSVYGAYGDHIIRKELKYFNPNFKEVLGDELSDNIRMSYDWFYKYFKY